MNRTILTQFVVGLVLAAAGVTLFLARSNDVTTSAQTPTPYTSTWTAAEVLTVDALVGSTQVGQAAIGVWKWTVSGSITGGKSFTETWSAPSISGVSFSPNVNQGCTLNGINASLLMSGCFVDQDNVGGDNTSAYSFALRAPGAFNSTKARLNAGTGPQKTTSCINSPRNTTEDECLFQSGSYAFQHVYEPGFPERNRWLGSGVLMPLQWTVVGSFQ